VIDKATSNQGEWAIPRRGLQFIQAIGSGGPSKEALVATGPSKEAWVATGPSKEASGGKWPQ